MSNKPQGQLSIEQLFVNTFISAKFQSVFFTKINSKKRNLFLGKLYYKSPMFKSTLNYIDIKSNSSVADISTILEQLEQQDFFQQPYCLSYYENFDKKQLNLQEAMEIIVQSSMPTLILLSPFHLLASFEAMDSNVIKKCLIFL